MFETFGSSLAPLVVRAVALLVLIADGAVCQSPSIDFRWRLLEHFGALKSDGSMIDFHWNAAAVKYDPAYVSPPDGWPVEFDACLQADTSYRYTWTVDGGVVPPGSSPPCKMTQQFYPVPAAHTVTLTVTNSSGQAASTTHRIVPKHWLIVSIGDSYSSGEGAPDVHQLMDSPVTAKAGPQWEDRRCHRSAASGPARAALAVEQSDPLSTVTFLSFACSGAGMDTGLTGPYAGTDPDTPVTPNPSTAAGGTAGRAMKMLPSTTDTASRTKASSEPSDPPGNYPTGCCRPTPATSWLKSQINQIRDAVGSMTTTFDNGTSRIAKGRHIDALIIGGGVNDVGFESILEACFKGPPLPWPYPPAAPGCPADGKDSFFRQLAAIPAKYEQLAALVETNLDVSQIYLSEYPNPFNYEDGAMCSTRRPPGRRSLEVVPLSGIDAQGVAWLRDTAAVRLNQTLREIAIKHGWIFDSVWEQFANHGECADDSRRWFNTEEDARHKEGPPIPLDADGRPHLVNPSKGTMHPNEVGHAAHGTSLALLLEQRLLSNPSVFVRTDRHCLAGIPCSLTVTTVPAKVRFDNETVLFDANTPLVHTFHGNGTAHYVSVAPTGDYNEAAATFRVPLQLLTVRVDPFPVALRVPTDVTVHLTDAAGNPVDGTVSLQDPAASRPGAAAPAPQTYRTNALIAGHVFQANLHILHHRDGSVCTLVIATTALVVPRDSVDYDNTSKDVKFVENQGAGCEGP